ncbi:MAG: type IV secretion system DNA-binding domain-containing protein [bacterium]|nr:type IV secretion system DNA-binding domain-containing protein [bacterium]
MEQQGFSAEKKVFNSPEEELVFLRQEVARREAESLEHGKEPQREELTSETLNEYGAKPVDEVLASNHALGQANQEAIVLDLAPEAHDRKIEELIAILEQKGIKNTISIIQKLGDFHLEDDFHRFLVQYVKAGFPIKGLEEKTPLGRSLRSTLYEITLPELAKEEEEKELKQLISGMDQFYAGMMAVSGEAKKDEGSFTLEIANANGSDEFVFYASVPDDKRVLFEKQILSIFHNAKIREAKNDYNIFNGTGSSVASFAVSERNAVFPLKLYEDFDVDPLNVLLNSFSKIKKDGQGAAVQFIFRPAPDIYLEKYREVLKKLQKGVSARRASDIRMTFFGEMAKGFKDVITNRHSEVKKHKDDTDAPKIDDVAIEQVKNKAGSPILLVGIRIIASAESEGTATAILADLEAAFSQFENTHGNKLSFNRLFKGGRLTRLLHDFSFRIFEDDEAIPLNIKEVTTMMHFPSSVIKSSPQLKHAKAGSAAAPIDLPQEGVLLGINRNRTIETKIFMTKEDRLRHFYVIGQTGTGKTTLLKNMIIQDIQNGEGVCMIDPHGADIQDILASIPPNRYEDLIYFDPSYTERPMALNMLEYDLRYPEQKTFVVNEMLSIFNKLFDMKTAGGPMFEQYFRNAVLLTIEDPESGNTLLDVSRVLANKAFREMKLSRCNNPIVTQFWREVADKAGGEASLANIVPYIVSKFDNFLANDIMRPIIAQEKSSFNFREVMDSKKILLVNLAKGRLGDINANLIGLILVGKILMAALSRVDSYGKDLPPFYLYIDEFQNITTDSIATILSEARKYKLSLHIAHQFINQLEDDIKDAVFGNVGSLAIFRVGSEDAEFLAKQLEPVFTESDIINLDNRNAYLKLLVQGRPVKPFNMETMAPPAGNKEIIAKLKELSYLKFGRERSEVEREIMKKYQK